MKTAMTDAAKLERAFRAGVSKARKLLAEIPGCEAGYFQGADKAAIDLINKLDDKIRSIRGEGGDEVADACRATTVSLRAEWHEQVEYRRQIVKARMGTSAPRRELTAAECGFERERRLLGVRAV